MKLLSSLKQKKRYVVFEIKGNKQFSFQEIKEAVDEGLLLFLGQLGLSRASPLLIKEKFDLKTQRFIIKVNHKYVDELISGMILIKKVKNIPVIINSVITSGTLKKAAEKL